MNYVENEREEYEATYDRPPQRKRLDFYVCAEKTKQVNVVSGGPAASQAIQEFQYAPSPWLPLPNDKGGLSSLFEGVPPLSIKPFHVSQEQAKEILESYRQKFLSINLLLTTRVAYDRIVRLEAQVAGLKIERDTAAALVKSLLDQKALLEDRIATLQHRLVALDAPTEQKPSTGDLLARASSFDRPLDAYGR